jgi:hypothetical protein
MQSRLHPTKGGRLDEFGDLEHFQNRQTQDWIFHLAGKLGMNNLIIRNHASNSARLFKTADNR